MFQLIVELLIGGLLLGALYAMVALGLTLIYGVTRILNLAHGDFLMLAALLSYILFNFSGVSPLISLPITLPLFFLAGLAVERILIRPVFRKPVAQITAASILVTLGLSFFISDSVSSMVFRTEFGLPWISPPVVMGDIKISSVRLFILLIIIGAGIGLHIFLRRTFMGKAIRAVIQDKETTVIMGVNIFTLSSITFGISTVLAAMAGWGLVLITNLHPFIGMSYTIKACVIVILGGMGSIVGSVIGGIILGLTESYAGYTLGPSWAPATALIILIIILIVRPRGLFGYEE
jgi:branched-chain amino acid transport system permease protein